MESPFLLNLFRFYREGTLRLLKEADEELADRIPGGFPNSIKWNAGHILIVFDDLIMRPLFNGRGKYGHLRSFFKMGTRPSEWKESPITLKELCHLLQEQDQDFSDLLPERFNEPIARPVRIRDLELKTPGELLQFGTAHEAMHQGNIKGILFGLRGGIKIP
jgi:hypothetical protein